MAIDLSAESQGFAAALLDDHDALAKLGDLFPAPESLAVENVIVVEGGPDCLAGWSIGLDRSHGVRSCARTETLQYLSELQRQGRVRFL